MAFFALISILLLVNLLIAMFGESQNKLHAAGLKCP